MPRPGPRKPLLVARVDPNDITWLDQRAAAKGVTRSEILRRILTDARKRTQTPPPPPNNTKRQPDTKPSTRTNTGKPLPSQLRQTRQTT